MSENHHVVHTKANSSRQNQSIKCQQAIKTSEAPVDDPTRIRNRANRKKFASDRFDMIGSEWIELMNEYELTMVQQLILFRLRAGGYENTAMVGFYDRSLFDFAVSIGLKEDELIHELGILKEKGFLHYELIKRKTRSGIEGDRNLQVYMPSVLKENPETISPQSITKGIAVVSKRTKPSLVLAMWANDMLGIVTKFYGPESQEHKAYCQLLSMFGAQICSSQDCCKEPCGESCKRGECHALRQVTQGLLDNSDKEGVDGEFYHGAMKSRGSKNFLRKMRNRLGGEIFVCNKSSKLKVRALADGAMAARRLAPISKNKNKKLPQDFSHLKASPAIPTEAKREGEGARETSRAHTFPFFSSFLKQTNINPKVIIDDLKKGKVTCVRTHARDTIFVKSDKDKQDDHASRVVPGNSREEESAQLEGSEAIAHEPSETSSQSTESISALSQDPLKEKGPQYASEGLQENMEPQQANIKTPNAPSQRFERHKEPEQSTSSGADVNKKIKTSEDIEEELQAKLDEINDRRVRYSDIGIVKSDRPFVGQEIKAIQEVLDEYTRKAVEQERDESLPPEHLTKEQKKEMVIHKACEALALGILSTNSRAKVEYMTSKAARKRWRKSMELMLFKDKRSPEAIRSVMVWALNDSFWAGNIKEPKNLRKNFENMYTQMLMQKEKQAKQG